MSPGRTILFARLDRFGRPVLRRDGIRRSHLDDVGPVDRDGAGRDDVAGGVLRDDRAADHDERHRAPCRLRGGGQPDRHEGDGSKRFHRPRL
jgi:hypothetical protein